MWNSITDLLDLLMTSHEMTPDELDRLLDLARKSNENYHLEAKMGNTQLERRKPGSMVRKYVSGFANSDGGIFLLGVDEKNNWKIVGYEADNSSDSAQWARSCLQNLWPHFSPLPRLHVVDHPDGQVLVIAAALSLNLVPVTTGTGLIYYMRFHDETRIAQDWLIADLMLGRRQHPYLNLIGAEITLLSQNQGNFPKLDGADLHINFRFIIENNSLSWANDVKLGTISWQKNTQPVLSNHLLSYVDVKNSNFANYDGDKSIIHRLPKTNKIINLDPFKEASVDMPRITLPLRFNQARYWQNWKAAIYIMAEGTPPVWYQLSLRIDEVLHNIVVKNLDKPEMGSEHFQITRMTSERPIVAWEPLIPQ